MGEAPRGDKNTVDKFERRNFFLYSDIITNQILISKLFEHYSFSAITFLLSSNSNTFLRILVTTS